MCFGKFCNKLNNKIFGEIFSKIFFRVLKDPQFWGVSLDFTLISEKWGKMGTIFVGNGQKFQANSPFSSLGPPHAHPLTHYRMIRIRVLD